MYERLHHTIQTVVRIAIVLAVTTIAHATASQAQPSNAIKLGFSIPLSGGLASNGRMPTR